MSNVTGTNHIELKLCRADSAPTWCRQKTPIDEKAPTWEKDHQQWVPILNSKLANLTSSHAVELDKQYVPLEIPGIATIQKVPEDTSPSMSSSEEHHPLLPSDHARIHYAQEVTTSARRQTRRFLTSKTGHYAVLLLVSLDVSCVFADLIITSLACEGHVAEKDASKATETLGIVSLVFSCLFMLELLASIWAFGLAFFKSAFHCLDATVIVAGLIIDILLRGTLEEIGSIVVVLRLWRVLKIIDELSAGAAEQMEPLSQRIEYLEKANQDLEREIGELRRQQQDHHHDV